MTDLQAFTPNPTNYFQIGTGVVFYLFLLIATLLSMSTVYVLVRYSRSRGLGFLVSVIYAIIYLALVSDGISALNSLR